MAFGPQLWWGANPAFLLKYQRRVGAFDATMIYHEDIAKQSELNASIAIPVPETRKVSLQVETQKGPLRIELGALWSGAPKVGETFQVEEQTAGGGYIIKRDEVLDSDTFGFKGKLSLEKGAWHWYAQGAHMGLVADAGPTETITYTGWALKDSGSGNQNNFIFGFAKNIGDFQIGPNFLWQKPIIGPMPNNLPAPGRLRNVLDDPFAVRGNRETTGFEFLLPHDPTPATWMWAWDNDIREDAGLAWSLGFVYRDMPTNQDAAVFIDTDGVTTFPFGGSQPARSLWELRMRLVSKIGMTSRMVANIYAGMAEPQGYDPAGANTVLNRVIHRYGIDGRLTTAHLSLAGYLKFNDWGPYDYHRDHNLTFPVQIMGDLSYTLGTPLWFDFPQTRLGVRGLWRSLDENSNRFLGVGADPENGHEWEIRTYMHLAI